MPTVARAPSPAPLEEVAPITGIRRRGGVTGIPRVAMVPALVRELPIGPRDAFVLSQVDGQSSVETLVDVTGFDKADVLSILGRLVRLGAIAV